MTDVAIAHVEEQANCLHAERSGRSTAVERDLLLPVWKQLGRELWNLVDGQARGTRNPRFFERGARQHVANEDGGIVEPHQHLVARIKTPPLAVRWGRLRCRGSGCCGLGCE